MSAMLEVKDLEVSYGKIVAVKGISFTVDEGEVVTLIGTNDLWIAATALAHSMPEVTRNSAQFARVPGLDVVAYGPRAGG